MPPGRLWSSGSNTVPLGQGSHPHPSHSISLPHWTLIGEELENIWEYSQYSRCDLERLCVLFTCLSTLCVYLVCVTPPSPLGVLGRGGVDGPLDCCLNLRDERCVNETVGLWVHRRSTTALLMWAPGWGLMSQNALLSGCWWAVQPTSARLPASSGTRESDSVVLLQEPKLLFQLKDFCCLGLSKCWWSFLLFLTRMYVVVKRGGFSVNNTNSAISV